MGRGSPCQQPLGMPPGRGAFGVAGEVGACTAPSPHPAASLHPAPRSHPSSDTYLLSPSEGRSSTMKMRKV